ncbi:MAG TPA: hypothetical protein VMQ44_01500 [Candidatus Saccharimonadales bacterium]|nr:hypothetical protein [Candidatus Saccharimonadales bacterium]
MKWKENWPDVSLPERLVVIIATLIATAIFAYACWVDTIIPKIM